MPPRNISRKASSTRKTLRLPLANRLRSNAIFLRITQNFYQYPLPAISPLRTEAFLLQRTTIYVHNPNSPAHNAPTFPRRNPRIKRYLAVLARNYFPYPAKCIAACVSPLPTYTFSSIYAPLPTRRKMQKRRQTV